MLSYRIAANIEQAVRVKKFKIGEKLPTENEFCELFSMSRTTIRKALKNLSARGLVTIRKGSRVYVNELSLE